MGTDEQSGRTPFSRDPSPRRPLPEFDMLGGCLEVLVRRQQNQVVPPAQLDEQGIDGSDLHSTAATGVAHLRCFDVILPVWLEEGEGGEAVLDLRVDERFPGSVEVHMLDFQADLYGRQLEFLFARRLRAEQRFENRMALTRQISLDVAGARAFLSAWRP